MRSRRPLASIQPGWARDVSASSAPQRLHDETSPVRRKPRVPRLPFEVAKAKELRPYVEKLVTLGNTVVVIEHHLDVIKSADWIIDLGPEGGEKGGEVVVCGTPEQVIRNKKSYTAQALARVMRNGKVA